jgi:hypothetical protein
MRIAKHVSMLAFVAAFAVPPQVAAETTPVEGAIEAWRVFVQEAEGMPTMLRVLPCEGCSTKRFELSEDFSLIIDGQRVPNSQLEESSGRSGTVIYNLESGRAVHLLR